jgi:hypothetical protein
MSSTFTDVMFYDIVDALVRMNQWHRMDRRVDGSYTSTGFIMEK